MRTCRDFSNGLSYEVYVVVQSPAEPQEKPTFSGKFEYKVQSFGSCSRTLRYLAPASISSFCTSTRISWSTRVL